MLGAQKNVFVKKKKFKHKKLVIILLLLVVLSVTLSYVYVPEVQKGASHVWQWVVTLVMSFILVNGKFVLKAFAKKIFILSVIGLSKRFFIEKIFMENMMKLFIKKLPLKAFSTHAKQKVKQTKLWTKVGWAGGTSLFSVGGIYLFGDAMLLKVILAKFWSFMLALFSKFMIFIGYILLDSGWIRMIIEVFVVGYLMTFLEKIPFVHKIVIKFYQMSEGSIRAVGKVLERYFNLPAQKAINKLTIHTSTWMHKSMGTEGYETYHKFIIRRRTEKKNVYQQLEEYRNELKPSLYKNLKEKRKPYKFKRNHISGFEQLQRRQKTDFDLSESRLYINKEYQL